VNQVFGEMAQMLKGHIDILVNNAGHLVGRVLIADMSDEHWRQVIDVNMTTVFYCSRAVIPYMNTGWGRIVNMSSLAAQDGGGQGQPLMPRRKPE
jgi:3-oxoacyl-[acyl-carrier protein] reductase